MSKLEKEKEKEKEKTYNSQHETMRKLEKH
jgi:hypothetical protein